MKKADYKHHMMYPPDGGPGRMTKSYEEHLKLNSKISAYLCKGTSMYNDPTWKSKYIDNINWGYKEKIMDLNISNTQNYHYSKTKAIIPLLIKKS